MASKPRELKPEDLYRKCDFGKVDFSSTEDLEPLTGIFGQSRVEDAVEFGIEIEKEGYNIFAFGPSGTGKHSAIERFLAERTKGSPVPPEHCYVNNFDEPNKPCLLTLPAGRGTELVRNMERLVEEISGALNSAFESEEYQNRQQILEKEFKERQDTAVAELGEEAKKEGLTLLRTPLGVVFAPLEDGEVIPPENFQKLPQKERDRLEHDIEQFQERLKKVFHQFPRWQREVREKSRELDREVSRFAILPLIEEFREKYEGLEGVLAYVQDLEADVVKNVHSLIAGGDTHEQKGVQSITDAQSQELPFVRRYRVNLLADNSELESAPVVYEDNPTYANLIGRVEHISQMGALVTDFNLIKAGALHRANGGYLVLDALKVLSQPYAWQGLKRALQSRQIRIESLGQALSMISTFSLDPEPIDLKVKVVFVGHPHIYYTLARHDPDFNRLCKVPADFDDRIDRTPENLHQYAQLITRVVQEEKLRHLDRPAVARVIEHASRLAGDSKKLSLETSKTADLLREADHWASRDERDLITAPDVDQAVSAQIERSDRLRDRSQESILRNTILIDTEGEVVGQVNGLAVLQLGDFAFGRPSRITGRIRLGKGEVIDIEREVELSGPLHAKGVLILTGFLGSRYASEQPLSLSASLVFEQSYGGVDGDSASSAELYTLLSAIADAPIKQSFAVTGSVNQRGQIQAIGGVNEKIEGFFDICSARGLTGEQGVLIPDANIEHLMLRPDVVEAVSAGQFHIYPVETVDQGIGILTGIEAGKRDDSGAFPDGSINHRVEKRLNKLAAASREFSGSLDNGKPSSSRRGKKGCGGSGGE